MNWNENDDPWADNGKKKERRKPASSTDNNPELDEVIRQGQKQFQQLLANNPLPPKRVLTLALLVVVGLWLLSGFYRVLPEEQGVVLRFGNWVRTAESGLHYHLPWPIESVEKPNVTRIRSVEVGFRSGSSSDAKIDVTDESLMLTGDQNIIDIDYVVFWRISDAGQYLFNSREPQQTVKIASESIMREVIGQTPIVTALTEGRADIEMQVLRRLQSVLDEYKLGVAVEKLELQAVDPPVAVVDAFNEVRRAQSEKQTASNRAEAYRNEIIPKARGDAERAIQEAEAYRAEVVSRAQGEAARFVSVYQSYVRSKDVTQQRLYLETMEAILKDATKIVVPNNMQGLLPYFPLDPRAAKTPPVISSTDQQ